MVAVLTASPTRSKVRPHCGTASSRRYERRRPEKTPLYKIVSEHLEGWLENRAVAEQPVSAHIERELRSYLTCGILCFGFGRACCASCGQGFVVAFSCKGRGVCPSCNGRRMAQTAAHLVDRVIPPVPVRQWVISVPKRLRCFLADRPNAVAALTRIFVSRVERLLCTAADLTRAGERPSAARPRLGAVSFLHRFGSALNHHVHLQLRWENSGFSVDSSVRITLIDRGVPSYVKSLEHLLRYCARPPFALERLSVRCGEDGRISRVHYVLPRHKAANWVGSGRGRKTTRPDANGVVELSPCDFLDRLADLVPPPRKHRQRPPI